MDIPAEELDFATQGSAYAELADAMDQTIHPIVATHPLAHAALVENEATPLAFDVLICGLFFTTFLAGNAFFDWFIPACNGMEMLIISGATLLALRLFFTHPLLALTLAFSIGDPLLDTYGHCVMGL